MRTWVSDPHSGGLKIPKKIQEHTKQRILAYAEANYLGKYTRLDIRFRSQFCYIDAYVLTVRPFYHPLPKIALPVLGKLWPGNQAMSKFVTARCSAGARYAGLFHRN